MNIRPRKNQSSCQIKCADSMYLLKLKYSYVHTIENIIHSYGIPQIIDIRLIKHLRHLELQIYF